MPPEPADDLAASIQQVLDDDPYQPLMDKDKGADAADEPIEALAYNSVHYMAVSDWIDIFIEVEGDPNELKELWCQMANIADM